MNFLKRFTTWLLLLTVITASGLVSAKVASGSQNLSGGLHQENVTANALMHQAKIDFSYDAASGSPVVTKGISNPVPDTVARVIPGKGPFPTIGAPGSKDVFVTAADDIAGLNAKQLSKRLTIDKSDTFTVIEFPTPSSGIASPVFRNNPGFVGGGRTAGGAREFVIPNQSVPPNATVRIVK